MHTEEEARHKVCCGPLSNDRLQGNTCIGNACMAWRWGEPDTSEDFETKPLWFPYEGDDRPVDEPPTMGSYKPATPVYWIGAPKPGEDTPQYSCGWMETKASVERRRQQTIAERKKNKPRKGFCALVGPAA